MTPIITPAHVTSELFLIGFGATFLTAATVWVLWYVHETNFPDDIKDPGFFLTFIIVVVPSADRGEYRQAAGVHMQVRRG